MKFAILTFKNVGSGDLATILAGYSEGYNPNKWVAFRIRPSDSPALAVRETTDTRIRYMRNSVGTLTTDKPLVEIPMLLRRHVELSEARNSWYADDPADWSLYDTVPVTPDVLNTWRTHDGFWEGYRQCLLRLLTRSGETFSGNGIATAMFNGRISDMAYNARALAFQRVEGRSWINATRFEGLLTSDPGARWRGVNFDVRSSDVMKYIARRNLLKRVGNLFRRCIAAARKGEETDGLLSDLEEILHERDNLPLMTDNLSHVAGLLPKLNRLLLTELEGHATLSLRACGHFEFDDRGDTVLRGGRVEAWCEYCVDTDAVRCADNGALMYREDAYYHEDDEEYYSYPEEDEAASRDYEDETRSILDYSTNVTRILRADPNIKSSPYGNFLMGIELEMTTGRSDKSRNQAAADVQKQLGKDYCVIKNDGSLPDDGFEVVTAPRGLAEHIERFGKWQIDPGYRAWDTNQCGLHVHLHSRAFTEMSLGKFLMFINLDTNAPFLRKLAGRHPFQDNWAARYCAQEGMEVLENPKAAVKGKSQERYRMVNTQNLGRAEAERLGLDPYAYGGKYDTVELRVFKASLKKERLLAQIEFAHASVAFCRAASWKDLSGNSFIKWLKMNTSSYPHLADWYGIRKSKVLKEIGKPLEEVCTDKVVGETRVPTPARRATTRAPLPANINQFLTPRERREAAERQLREVVERERERLRLARERASQLAAQRAGT